MYQTCYSLTKKTCSDQLSYIEVVGNIKNKELTVVSIMSFEKNKGHATNLMIHACREYLTYFNNPDVKLYLDDCSDRFRNPHNLYKKLGMIYNDTTGPEMTGSVQHVSNLPISLSKNLIIRQLSHTEF